MKNRATILIWALAFCVWSPWALAVFNKSKPASSTSMRNSNPEILANWSALEDAIDREHSFSTGGTVAAQGEHTQGSARVFFQDAAPTTQVDGGAFASTDLGSLWVDTNSSPDNQFNILTATTPTWTPVSTEVIATLLASNRVFAGTVGVDGNFEVGTGSEFTVAAATGNTVIAGTLGVTGVATLGDGSLLAAATEAADGDRVIADVASVKSNGFPEINTTPTAVFTKYFTGNLDADSSTSVAHGVSTGLTKILSITASAYDDGGSVLGSLAGSVSSGLTAATHGYYVFYDATNVTFDSVGTNLQGNRYTIKIDYIL